MSFVYAIKERGNIDIVKIGYSKTPESRLQSMQTGNPRELFLFAYKEGTRKTEIEIHSECHHLHIRGEWFRLGEPLNSIIESMQRVATDFEHLRDIWPVWEFDDDDLE